MRNFNSISFAELQRRYLLVDYTVISGDNHKITAELFAKDANVVLAFDPQDHVRAEVLHAVTSPLGMIRAPDLPFVRQDQVALTDLLRGPLVVPRHRVPPLCKMVFIDKLKRNLSDAASTMPATL